MPKHFCWKQYTHITHFSFTLVARVSDIGAYCAWIDCMQITILAVVLSITWLLILNSECLKSKRQSRRRLYAWLFKSMPDCLIVFTFFVRFASTENPISKVFSPFSFAICSHVFAMPDLSAWNVNILCKIRTKKATRMNIPRMCIT